MLAAWKLNNREVALVVGRTIYLHKVSRQQFLQNPQWVRHEVMHVHQYKKYGLARFLALYLWNSACYGYSNNRFEVEARLKENDDALLKDVRFN